MTLDEALEKRDEARARRRGLKRNDETPIGLLNAEYDWGFWDAVVTLMKNLKLEQIEEKAVL